MKKLLLTLFIFGIFIGNPLNAQCINGVKSYPIYKMGAKVVEEFDNEGYEIVRIEYDLVFDSKESFRTLTDSWEYTIIGFADEGVKDLDLKVYEYDELIEKWTLIVEDKESEPFATVTVSPSVTALYKVEVIVYEFYEGYSAARYGLMYVHE